MNSFDVTIELVFRLKTTRAFGAGKRLCSRIAGIDGGGFSSILAVELVSGNVREEGVVVRTTMDRIRTVNLEECRLIAAVSLKSFQELARFRTFFSQRLDCG